jgi:hypothetical protein
MLGASPTLGEGHLCLLLYLFPVTIVLCVPNHAVQAQERGEGLEDKDTCEASL